MAAQVLIVLIHLIIVCSGRTLRHSAPTRNIPTNSTTELLPTNSTVFSHTPTYTNLDFCRHNKAEHPITKSQRDSLVDALRRQDMDHEMEWGQLSFDELKVKRETHCVDLTHIKPFESPIKQQYWVSKETGLIHPEYVVNAIQCGHFSCPKCGRYPKTEPKKEKEEEIYLKLTGCSYNVKPGHIEPKLYYSYWYVKIEVDTGFPCTTV